MQTNRSTAVLLPLGLVALLYCFSVPPVWAQATVPATNPPPLTPSTTNSPTAKSTNDLIQLSFQGANIDMIAQWLAETTGKNVIKHPQAQCQVTIVGSKKVTRQQAVTMIYHALQVEGFTAIETPQSILIVPEGKEPKLSPQMLGAGQNETEGGHEREVRVFTLQYAQAAGLKDKIKSVLSEKATVDTDDHANALVITDFHDNVAVAADLIHALDIDRTQDTTLRVIPLKNANAIDLAKELQPLYGKAESKDPIEVSANDRSNSLLVRSSLANFKIIKNVVTGLDTEEAQDKVMRSFTLKNADAEDVAKQLQDLNADQDNNTGPFRVFYFGGGGGNNSNSKKMSVVADRRRNAVIVQADPMRLERVAKMVQALDQPINDDSLAPRIYPLKYVSAADIEDVLNELFLKKTQARPYYYFDEEPEPTADRDVGRLYGKVRITSEPYANAIIVTANSLENLEAVEEVLKQLDVPSEAGESTFRVGLRFADAPVMANSINILFAKGGSPAIRPSGQQNQNNNNNNTAQNQQQNQTQQTDSQNNFEITEQNKEEGYYPWIGGQPDNPRANDTRAQRPVSDLIGRVRVVPDQRSNSLLISANVHFFPQLLKLIEEMDVPTAEVMIEARIVEVSSGLLDQVGVRWSPNTSTFTANDYDNSIIASPSASYQKAFGGTQYYTPNNNSSNVVGSALSGIRSGLLANSVNADVLIQFLKENTGATVLGEPQLEIKDNELGKLFVGQEVPILTGSLTTDVGGLNQSFQYKDVGVILEVQPHINESGDVQLRIRAESSTLVAGETLLGGAIINTRNFRTELTAKSGQTLVLGGIIQNQSSDAYRKTPILGDIPGLKWLFDKKDKSNQRVELLVFLRPKVTRTPDEARALLEDANKRMPLVRDWEKTEADNQAKSPPKKP
ncbi:MAG TPA: secretin N-terminal domain-containing protein [Verrucomicrobiae bacterium]|nr:secretin N-terminal domain-containing protein [Verrucomicrobiae bacterium]